MAKILMSASDFVGHKDQTEKYLGQVGRLKPKNKLYASVPVKADIGTFFRRNNQVRMRKRRVQFKDC